MSDSKVWRVLCLGDIVGKEAGRLIDHGLKAWRQVLGIDFCVANGENAIDGSGLNGRTARWLMQSGCDVITTGDHVWKRIEIKQDLNDPRILRPLNFQSKSAGKGWTRRRLLAPHARDEVLAEGEEMGPEIGVINVMGQVFTRSCDNPYDALDQALTHLQGCAIIVVDIHAEATAEKATLAHYLDRLNSKAQKIQVVFGTHTHVPTADERVLPHGTGFITDVGMCGPHHSIIGREITPVLEAAMSSEYRRFHVAKRDLRLNGAVFTIDKKSRRCVAVERVCLREDEIDGLKAQVANLPQEKATEA